MSVAALICGDTEVLYARRPSSGHIHVLLFLFCLFGCEEVRVGLELWKMSFSSYSAAVDV